MGYKPQVYVMYILLFIYSFLTILVYVYNLPEAITITQITIIPCCIGIGYIIRMLGEIELDK